MESTAFYFCQHCNKRHSFKDVGKHIASIKKLNKEAFILKQGKANVLQVRTKK